MVEAKIEHHGHFDWRWRVENVVGFTMTRYGAIRAAKNYVRLCENYRLAKETAEIICLGSEQ